jgi:tRNA pseudouridine65 synthase
MTLQIIYQDQHMVAIHKPPGLLVHRSLIDKHETQFAMQMLRDQIGQHVFPVHRLDRPTSGVLLFALSSDIARLLNQQLSSHQVQKTYYAIVRGFVDESGHIDYALKEKLDKIADKHANQDKEAQEAQTDYQMIDTFELAHPVGRYASARYSLVRLLPTTGRKHQLRRHMSHINHPIVGDTTHGDGKQNKFVRQMYAFNGLALTCKEMVLTHPVEQTRLCLQADFDERMKKLLASWGWGKTDFRKLEK